MALGDAEGATQREVNKALFQNQDKGTQEILLRAGKEASEHCRQLIIAKEGEIIQELINLGMEIVDPADNEKEFIEKATQTVWPKFYKSVGGKGKIEEA